MESTTEFAIGNRQSAIGNRNVPQRIASILALVAFALCLVVGSLHAGNTFTTTVTRALAAMGATFVIGLAIGLMGQRMLEENLRAHEEKLKEGQAKVQAPDR